MRNARAAVLIACLLLSGALAACTRAATTPGERAANSPDIALTATPPTPAPQIVVVTATPIPDPESPCLLTQLDDVDEVVIGALVPLSNPGNMRSGFAMQAALNIAVDDINSGGGIRGKPVRLVTYDTAGIPSRAEEYMEHLVTQDCARAVVGLYHNNVARIAAESAHRLGIPLILAEPMADELTELHYPEVFRIAPVMSELSSLDARWLSELGDINQDDSTLVVNIFEDSAYGHAQMAQTETQMEAHQLDSKSILVDLPTRDWSPVVARIVDLEQFPDAVFIHFRDESALVLQQQLLDAGIGPEKQTIIVNSPVALNDLLFWQLNPDGVNTIVRQIGPWAPTVTPLGQAFAEKYRRIFDNWPERYAFGAYDAFRLAADAIERADSLEGFDLVAALEATETTLAAGDYYFPYGRERVPNGTTEPDYLWHQWPDVHTLFLRYTEANQSSADMQVLWPQQYATEAITVETDAVESP